ncbi:cellulose biosynthesis protein BcsG, partial [Burkholderia pseudomallei]
MTFWNLYFVLKLYLFAAGHLKPLWIANLGFALALALSAPARRRSVQLLRHALALALAVPLMYREADVPPLARLVETLGGLRAFSAGYWMELVPRFVPPMLALAALGVVIGYLIVNRWLRVATFVLLALIALPVWQAGSAALARLD